MLAEMIRKYPNKIDTAIATSKGKIRIGMRKEDVIKNFDKKVQIVAVQICLNFFSFSDSSDIWIPRASDTESAMAIDIIPPTIIVLLSDRRYKAKVIPKVVITPDVSPNPIPFVIPEFKFTLL